MDTPDTPEWEPFEITFEYSHIDDDLFRLLMGMSVEEARDQEDT